MESDEDTGGEDVVDQDPPVQADHSEKNSHKKKKKTKEEIKAEKQEVHRQAFEAFKQGQYPSVNSCAPASDLPDEAILLASEENSGANIDVVDLSNEADMEEAVLRSLKDRNRETDPISQPGCSHWSISQPGAPSPGSSSTQVPVQSARQKTEAGGISAFNA